MKSQQRRFPGEFEKAQQGVRRIFTLGLGGAADAMHENILVVACACPSQHRAEALCQGDLRFAEGCQLGESAPLTRKYDTTPSCAVAAGLASDLQRFSTVLQIWPFAQLTSIQIQNRVRKATSGI